MLAQFDGTNLVIGHISLPVRAEAIPHLRDRPTPETPVDVIPTRNPHYPGGLDVLAPAGSWTDPECWLNHAMSWAGRAVRGRDDATDAMCLTLSRDEIA